MSAVGTLAGVDTQAVQQLLGAKVVDRIELRGGATVAVVESAAGFGSRVIVEREGSLRLAAAGDGASEGMLDVIRTGSAEGAFQVTALRPVPEGSGERAIVVDQSNESIVVGEAVVMKRFPDLWVASGIDVATHLASAGFTEAPVPYGALTWRAPHEDELLIATAAEYLPGARDGWDWYLQDLLGWLRGAIDDVDVSEPAAAIGGLVARMHIALATPSDTFPDPVHEAGAVDIATWAERAGSVLERAVDVTDGPAGGRLRARRAEARSEIEALSGITRTLVTRVHGDLHVGQVLRWGGGYAVIDLDGNPLAPSEIRSAPHAPARDVASMLRSLDHLGRIALRDGEGSADRIENWIAHVRRVFTTAYCEELEAADQAALLDSRLVRPFEVEQACHEFVYSATHLPTWTVVADLAMTALLAPTGT